MKKWQGRAALAAVATLSLVGPVRAEDVVVVHDQPIEHVPEHRYYRAEELSLDIFGTLSAGQETLDNLSGTTVKNNGRIGAGAGLNYFVTRFVGIGADAYSEDTHHSFVDSASGNLILRLPIGETILAPYIFGGGGYQFDNIEQSFGQVGGGLELRFVHEFGIFVDGRYVIAHETENYGVGRAGIRLSF